MSARPRIKSPKEVREIVTALLTRPEGATRKEIYTALDWPSVDVGRQARIAGLRLRIDQSNGHKRYFGHKPTFTIRDHTDDEPGEEPTAEVPKEALEYYSTAKNLHVIGPPAILGSKRNLRITLETMTDAEMKGKTFDVIIDPGEVRIVLNKKRAIWTINRKDML